MYEELEGANLSVLHFCRTPDRKGHITWNTSYYIWHRKKLIDSKNQLKISKTKRGGTCVDQ